jgi:hypothetical protein
MDHAALPVRRALSYPYAVNRNAMRRGAVRQVRY